MVEEFLGALDVFLYPWGALLVLLIAGPMRRQPWQKFRKKWGGGSIYFSLGVIFS
ncbi:hypothetical protein HMPREF0577_0175 [Mobiluncus mulieris ATCC 35243]|nr:hypothetical protein HMPREF0577_0175 [Mobiluncus mulieris ATCC 35243]